MHFNGTLQVQPPPPGGGGAVDASAIWTILALLTTQRKD